MKYPASNWFNADSTPRNWGAVHLPCGNRRGLVQTMHRNRTDIARKNTQVWCKKRTIVMRITMHKLSIKLCAKLSRLVSQFLHDILHGFRHNFAVAGATVGIIKF